MSLTENKIYIPLRIQYIKIFKNNNKYSQSITENIIEKRGIQESCCNLYVLQHVNQTMREEKKETRAENLITIDREMAKEFCSELFAFKERINRENPW